jgi:C1A family cysteine protease
VWTNFGDVRGDEVYTTPRGRHEGNHMMVAVAFRPGAICFRNTWGAGFGDRGHVWISTDFLDGPNGLDAWCVTAAPPLH